MHQYVTYIYNIAYMSCGRMLSHFSHVQLCDAMGYSLPGSSVHGILQAWILEWVAMPSSYELYQLFIIM